MFYNKMRCVLQGSFLAFIIWTFSGCEEEETDPCEDMSAFACDCMTDTNGLVYTLDDGLQLACQHMLDQFEDCMVTMSADLEDWIIIREARGPDEILASDLCDGHGIEGMPGGCMSQNQFDDLLLRIDNQGCSALSGPGPLWDELIGSFRSWRRYWLAQ